MAKKKRSKKTRSKDRSRPEQKEAEATEATESSTAVVTSDYSPTYTEVLADAVDTETVNRVTLGELVLHYPTRDVVLALDGATAARVVAAFAKPERRRHLQDTLDTTSSSMRNLWATFDLDSLLAVSWLPGLPSKASKRMTVDPPSPTELAEPTTAPGDSCAPG
jgi:hypothetical protein